MIANATIYVYVPAIGKNSEGTLTKTWGYKQTPKIEPSEILRADVQPKGLSPAQIELWGLSDRSEGRAVFFDRSQYMDLNTRVYVISDFPNEPLMYYEVKSVDRWPSHGEALFVPVQGE